MSLLVVLALVVSGTLQFEPATPTVGDLVTINFPDPGEGKLSLLPSDEFEVVEVTGGKAVVRSFRPGTIHVVGEILTPGRQTQRHTVEIAIRSVLAENDDLQPAPLVLPKEIRPNNVAWWMIGSAAAGALAVWALLYFMTRRMSEAESDEGAGAIDPSAAFLERLNRIGRLSDEEERWRLLADSTRWFLPRVDALLGPELTTSEILERMRSRQFDGETVALVERVLHGGDWAKFSPFGAPNDTSDTVIARARQLASLVSREVAA